MSAATIKAELKKDDPNANETILQKATNAVIEWAKKQPAKQITQQVFCNIKIPVILTISQAIRTILIGAGIAAGPAGIAAAAIALFLTSSTPAY